MKSLTLNLPLCLVQTQSPLNLLGWWTICLLKVSLHEGFQVSPTFLESSKLVRPSCGKASWELYWESGQQRELNKQNIIWCFKMIKICSKILLPGVMPLKSPPFSISSVLRPPFNGVSTFVRAIIFWASCKTRSVWGIGVRGVRKAPPGKRI